MAAPAAVLRILVSANGTQAITSLKAVEAQTGKTAAAGGRMGKALQTAGKAAALATGALGVASVKLAADFDKSMRNVNSLAGLPESGLKSLEKRVLSLAGKTAQAPKTLAEGLYDLVSSGFDAKESMKILASSAKAASAGLTTTEVSTKAVAAVLNAYHLKAKDAAKVSDTLFQTVNYGVLTFDELANTIGDVLPFSSQLGVSLNQVGAAVSTMTKAGINPAETMTRIKNVFVALIKPSDALSKAIKATGYESGEALIKAKGFQGALDAIVGTTNGSKAAVAQLFPNIRALGGALALTGKNSRGANADLKNFANTSGATNRVFNEQMKALSNQWAKLKAQVSALLIQFGMQLIPTLTKVTGWFAKNKTALTALGAALAAGAAAWIAFKVQAAAAAAVTTIATGGLNLIIPALVALAAGIAVAYKRSDKFRAVVKAAFEGAKAAVVAVIHVILTVIDKWLGGLQAVMDAASHLPVVGKKFRGIADDIGHAREKVRNLRDAVDNLNGRKVSVQVQVNALLQEFEAGKIPKLFNLKTGPPHKQMGGLVHRATGGIVVPGSGSGDKVPLQAMVEPGEQVFVLNRNASATLDFLQGMNAAVPRFATGGKLSLAHPGRQIRQAVTSMAKAASARWLKNHPTRSVGASGGQAAGSAQMRAWAAAGLRAAGVPATAVNIATIVGRMMQESGGNPKAINLWDSNAKAGHPSQGLMQTIPSTFSAYHVPGTSGNITDPVANVAAAVRYMLSRYGHLVGSGPGGYKRGGLIKLQRGGGVPPINRRTPQAITGPGVPPKTLSGVLKLVHRGGHRKLRQKAIRGLIDRVKGIGLPPKLRQQLAGREKDSSVFGDMASRAQALTTEDQDGNPILGVVGGLTEADWLNKQLAALFEWRNAILRADEIVRERRDKVAKLLERARKRLEKVTDAIRRAAVRRKQLQKALATARKHKQKGRAKTIAKQIDTLDGRQRARGRVQSALKDRIIPALVNQRKDLSTARGNMLTSLEQIQGVGSPMGVMKTLPAPGVLGGSILDVQLRLRDLATKPAQVVDTSGSAVDDTQSELADLLKQKNTELAQALQVSQAQYKVFQGLPFMGAFARGGVALLGERGPELAHIPSGTRVHSARDTQQMLTPDVRVVVNGDIVNTPAGKDPVEVLVNDRRFEQAVKRLTRAQRPLPGRGGGGLGR